MSEKKTYTPGTGRVMSDQGTSSSDGIRIPITSWLQPASYRRLEAYAKPHKLTVGQILAELADKASGVTPGRRKHNRMTPERLNRIVKLHQAGTTQTAIAAEVGVSLSSVNSHLAQLGLRKGDRS